MEWKRRAKARVVQPTKGETEGPGVVYANTLRIGAVMTGRFFVQDGKYSRFNTAEFFDEVSLWASRKHTYVPGSSYLAVEGVEWNRDFMFKEMDDGTWSTNRLNGKELDGGGDPHHVIWWTATGMVFTDNFELYRLGDCSDLMDLYSIDADAIDSKEARTPQHPLFATVPASMSANRSLNCNTTEFWSSLITWGYFGTIGVKAWDEALEQVAKKVGARKLNDKELHCCAFCGKREPASLSRCVKCKRVYYCDREHQKMHWNEHKAICSKKPLTHNDQPSSRNTRAGFSDSRITRTSGTSGTCAEVSDSSVRPGADAIIDSDFRAGVGAIESSVQPCPLVEAGILVGDRGVLVEGLPDDHRIHNCMGVYERMPHKIINGRGVWRKEDGRVLYFSSHRMWFIGWQESMSQNQCAMGVESAALTPDEITGTWKVVDERGLSMLPGVRVRKLTTAAQQEDGHVRLMAEMD
jgi:hypothetical protein